MGGQRGASGKWGGLENRLKGRWGVGVLGGKVKINRVSGVDGRWGVPLGEGRGGGGEGGGRGAWGIPGRGGG